MHKINGHAFSLATVPLHTRPIQILLEARQPKLGWLLDQAFPSIPSHIHAPRIIDPHTTSWRSQETANDGKSCSQTCPGTSWQKSRHEGVLVYGTRTWVGMATGKTYRGRYFPRARNPPKWVSTTRKNPSPIDGKETFHIYPRSPLYMVEKESQNSSHAWQIVASKRKNN